MTELVEQIQAICGHACSIHQLSKCSSKSLRNFGLRGDEAEYCITFRPVHEKEVKELLATFQYEIKRTFFAETIYNTPVTIFLISKNF